MAHTWLVAVYDCAMQYGGPEEGGWWYDSGSLVRVCRIARNEDTAYAYCCRLNAKLHSRVIGPNQGRREYTSAASTGEVQAMVFEDFAPQGFPDRKPRYE